MSDGDLGQATWKLLDRFDRDLTQFTAIMTKRQDRLEDKIDSLTDKVESALKTKASQSSVDELRKRVDAMLGTTPTIQGMNSTLTKIVIAAGLIAWLLVFFKGPIVAAITPPPAQQQSTGSKEP